MSNTNISAENIGETTVSANETTASSRKATTPKAKKKDRNSELVEIKLFQDGGKYKDDVTVIVNGKSYRIQRGKTVKIPRSVALVLERSMKQDTATAQLIAREAENAKNI